MFRDLSRTWTPKRLLRLRPESGADMSFRLLLHCMILVGYLRDTIRSYGATQDGLLFSKSKRRATPVPLPPVALRNLWCLRIDRKV
jgi:hypothetical protein